MRPPVDPLPREIEQLVTMARKGQLEGQLECSMGTIADLGGFVTSYALCYLTNQDAERALECLQVAAEAYVERGLQRVLRRDAEEDLPGKVWPIPPDAVYRPCKEEGCRKLITQIVTRLDGNGKPVYLPVTREGRSHFEDCTNPKRFSGKGRAKHEQDATPAQESKK